MEFGLREILILVGIVIIGVIVIDGLRRMRHSRRSSLGMSLDVGGSVEDVDHSGELPGGGARVAEGYELEDRLEPSFINDVVDYRDVADYDDPLFAAPKREPAYSQQQENEEAEALGGTEGEQQELFADSMEGRPVTDSVYQRREVSTSRQARAKSSLEPALQPKKEVREVVIINVMAKTGTVIEGRQLLPQLINLGFRFGDMNIFHRHEHAKSSGCLMFSLANIVEPGTFDIDNIGEFTTPGICMFLSLPGPKKSMYAFDLLVDAARKVSISLNCDMLDENHSVMTQQTIEHYRQRVLEFERRQLTPRPA